MVNKTLTWNDFFVWLQDINVCILENYPECSNPRVFYIIPYFCGQHPQCRYLTPTFLPRFPEWAFDLSYVELPKPNNNIVDTSWTLLHARELNGKYVLTFHLLQGTRSLGSGEGQTERAGELPPCRDPGGAGGRSAPVGEALTSLFFRSAQHL